MKYKLSPSKSHRYLNCTKSLEYDKEFVDTPVTVRGKILHQYAEMLLNKQDTREFTETNKINKYEDFLVNSYVKAVYNEYNLINARKMTIEKKESIEIYWFKINLIMDALIIGNNIASIVDLKSGYVNVEVEDNEQLMFYAFCVLTNHKKVKTLRLSIFQKGRLKTVELTSDEVMEFFLSKYDVFEQIYNDELTYNPSEKACKYCNHKDKCLARARWIVGGKDGITKV